MIGKIVWALPVKDEDSYGTINYNAKYHCFDGNNSLCGKYQQINDCFDVSIENGEVLSNPHIACKTCLKKWKKELDL